MPRIHGLLFLLLATTLQTAVGQSALNAKKFFTDESVLRAILSTDLRELIREKATSEEQQAVFTLHLPGDSSITEAIRVSARGVVRRKTCNLPPLRLNFNNPASPTLKPLKSLKLVNNCRGGNIDEQYVLREYLAYKIFNLITDRSFRVRLLLMTYEDSEGKKKPNTDYAFFIEDVDEMAKRNKCKELNNMTLNTVTADSKQMVLVDLFQYMIGNTDWSVPNTHNVKLILPRKKDNVRPLVVPYDFDYAGLVNADYASPDPVMGIEHVTERVYRGFPHTMAELQTAIMLFNTQKENIYALVNNFEPLKNKKWIIKYLDEFYNSINDENKVQQEFIENARKQ